MLDKERITIDITSERIAILAGTRFKIDHAALIETPYGAYENDEIVDVDKLKVAIMPELSSSNVKKKIKDIYFVIRGEDLILRQITLPMMKDDALKDSVKWELSQVVGDRAEEYYVDYEVLTKKSEGSDQNVEVLMVATLREKVLKYLELGKELGYRVRVVDMCANLTSRIMRAYQDVFKNGVKSVGVLDLGADSAGFAILDKGRLMHYKYQEIGIKSMTDKIFESRTDYHNFLNKIDLNNEVIDDITDGKAEIFLSQLSYSFNSIVQFYTSGKVKKTLDKIFILGSGNKISGYKEVIEDAFNTQVEHIPDFEGLRTSVKYPKNIKLEDYFYAYSLMLKQDEKELNLVPQEEELEMKKQGRKKSAVALSILVGVLMILGFAGVKGYEVALGFKEKALQQELAKSQELIDEEAELDRRIALVNEHIQIAQNVDSLKSKETDNLLKELNKLMPGEILISSLSYSKDTGITLSGSAKSQPAAEIFYANLRESKEFKNCHIGSIANNDGSVTFNVEITLAVQEEVVDNVEA